MFFDIVIDVDWIREYMERIGCQKRKAYALFRCIEKAREFSDGMRWSAYDGLLRAIRELCVELDVLEEQLHLYIEDVELSADMFKRHSEMTRTELESLSF